MRAASYARKSKKIPRGQQSASVDRQLAENRDRADILGATIIPDGELADDGKSASRFAAKNTEREDFDRLLGLIHRREIDIAIMWEQSRATREVNIVYELVNACDKADVLLDLGKRTYDCSRSDDRFQLGLNALLDAREADVIHERLSDIVRDNALAGKPHGRVLFGYKRIYDPETRTYLRTERHPVYQPLIAEALQRIADNEPLIQISRDLQSRGIGAYAFTPSQLRNLATNPHYAGKRVYRGEIVGDAKWPPIVDDPDLQRRAAAVVLDPSRKTTRPGTRKWLLTGNLMRCGTCHARKFQTGLTRGKYRYYRCIGCFKVGIAALALDAYVMGLVVERFEQEDIKEVFRVNHTSSDAAAAAEAEADALRQRLDSFIDQAADGGPTALSPVALAKVEARLLPQIAAAEERARRLSTPAVFAGTTPETLAADWLEWAQGKDLPRAQRILAATVDLTVKPAVRWNKKANPSARVVHVWKI